LICTALPWAAGIAEIRGDVGGNGEPLVSRHLRAPIPGEGFIEVLGKLLRVFDERVNYRFTVLAVNLDEHDIARMSLDKRGNPTVTTAAQEVALLVPRNRAVFNSSGTFVGRNRIPDTAVILSLLRVMT
jgi:hypothetical protein